MIAFGRADGQTDYFVRLAKLKLRTEDENLKLRIEVVNGSMFIDIFSCYRAGPCLPHYLVKAMKLW